jgi:hypothetical protein
MFQKGASLHCIVKIVPGSATDSGTTIFAAKGWDCLDFVSSDNLREEVHISDVAFKKTEPPKEQLFGDPSIN